MERHKFNLFPKASPDDYQRLLEDMRVNGYDGSLPIMLYQGAILDGWNRYSAANELGFQPATAEFAGDDDAALMYTLRTNKRRNLSSSQWAAVAVEADGLLQSIRDAVEAARLEKQKLNAVNQYTQPSDNKLSEPTQDEHAVEGLGTIKERIAAWYSYADKHPRKPIDVSFLNRRIQALESQIEEAASLARKLLAVLGGQP